MKSTKIVMLGSAALAAILLSASVAFAALPVASGFIATSTSPTTVNLSWTISGDPAVAGYKIYQAGTQIATVTPISAVSYPVTGLNPSTAYVFGISTYNSAETSSMATTSITTLSDTSAPVSTSQINLLWAAATDNVAVSGYYVYRNDSLIATTSALSIADSGLATSTLYKYNVSAYDAAGNISATSSSVSATTLATSTPDTTIPTQPTNLSAAAISSSQINITWTASTDNLAVSGYKVYRNGSFVTNSTSASYGDSGLLATTTYSYNVIAYDAAGNLSATSSTASATTLATSVSTTTAKIRIIGNGEYGKIINLRSNGKIQVVVYGGSSFNVKNLDRATVTFAGAPAINNWRQWHNRDKYMDRVFTFRIQDMKDLMSLASTTTSAEVSFKAVAAGVSIDIRTTVRIKNLKKWHEDRDKEHEQEDAKEALKKEQEHLREDAKKALETQRELLKQEQEKIRESSKEIKNNLKSDIKELKSEIKNNRKGNREDKED
jgi:chitodextrinase